MIEETTSFEKANRLILDVHQQALQFFESIELSNEYLRVINSPIPPEKVSHYVELVYANINENPPQEILDTAASISAFATSLGFYGLSENDRGFNITKALRGLGVSSSSLPESHTNLRGAKRDEVSL